MLERTLWTLNCNSFECGAVREQLVIGFGQWIQKRIIINLSFACIILLYDIIAYYTLFLVLSIYKQLCSVSRDYLNPNQFYSYDDLFQGIYNWNAGCFVANGIRDELQTTTG